jgi:hypothetical protein
LLGETLKQFVHHFGGDLIGAVEDDTQPAQRLGKILGRFGLTCTRRPRRTSPQLIRQGRCDGNPTPISQGRNNQSGGGPKILIPILQRRGNLLMYGLILLQIVSELLLPQKIVQRLTLVLIQGINDIPVMNLDRDQGHDDLS